jgi:hypothetical protein
VTIDPRIPVSVVSVTVGNCEMGTSSVCKTIELLAASRAAAAFLPAF